MSFQIMLTVYHKELVRGCRHSGVIDGVEYRFIRQLYA